MASADGDEMPSTAPAPAPAPAPSSVDTGDATSQLEDGAGDIAKPTTDATDAIGATTNSTQEDKNNDNNSPVPPVSNTALASGTSPPSPAVDANADADAEADADFEADASVGASADASDLPPRIVSDIVSDTAPPAAVSIPPRPAGLSTAAPSPPVASPASTASPSVHGLAARPGRTSMSNTPHQSSPALPSPPVQLRPSPATQPAPVNNTHIKSVKYQNNPVWRAESPREYNKKPQAPPIPIPIPSPAPSTPSLASVRTVSFPSPGREHIHADPKFLDDKTRITFGIHQAVPEAVRRSVRDNWEKCLLGSDFHQAFVLNASIHHATPAAVQRGIRDFGSALVSGGRAQIIEAMTPADIEAVAPQILKKASESFLDAALELRLRSIDAKRLINALARAERLGYEPSDVVEEDDDPALIPHPASHHVQAMPALAPQPPRAEPALIQPRAKPSTPQPRTPSAPAPKPVPQLAPKHAAPSDSLMYCDLCFRKFVYRSAYEHHVEKKVCTRLPVAPGGYRFSCQHCGQGFTTIMGVQYHNANNICGDYKDPWRPAPPPDAIIPATPTATATATKPTPKAPASAPTKAPPTLLPTPKSTQTAAPSSPSGGPRLGTPGLHTPDGAVADPYAHLSPEQLAAMQEELRLAELSYGERFRQANEIPDVTERKNRLEGLSNSFGTKQSLIRKKYGVRLRMRRTKAEIQAERDRMQYRTAAELQADNGIVTANPGRPGRPPASTPTRPPAVVARRSNGGTGATWASVNRPGAPAGAPAPQAHMSTTPVPVPVMGRPGLGNKRRVSGSSPYPESKRVAYSDMGGLSGGTTAHVETMDPTLPPAPGARKASTLSAKGLGTADEPMALDDSDSESDDSVSPDEDIPAELPPSVRQSLQQASPSVTPGPQPA